MDVTHLLLATLLVCLCFLTARSHLAPEEKPRDDKSLRSNSSMNLLDSPSVSIVAPNKKSKKKKASMKRVARPRDPPPVPCVATLDICRQPAPASYDPWTSGKYRFFRSACSYHVLNRNC